MGLGLAALALGDRDSRSKEWLDTAVDSAYSGFDLFSEGGSYFEGLSYASYAMRLLLQFCEAHYRVNGTVNWTNAVNWSGFVENVAAMQAGSKADGTPDVVNFSDASASIHPCVGSWIRERTGNPLAQYAAKNFGAPGYFLDFLWYRPLESSRPPREVLKNYHDDLDWIICRSGWEADDAVLAFRSGDPANHEHADRNSFLYKIYGERLLNDHFGAAYERRDPKWTLRMTKAHNAVLIGGRGHQYHEGEEGVNEGQAEAEVVKFVDEGERVWWCSDATHAYQLVNENVSKVLRTVVFAKPNIIVVLDQVDLKSVAEEVEIRFFPDNRDEQAGVEVEESGFSITRPKASLHSHVASSSTLLLSSSKLDPIEDFLSKESVDDKRAGEIRYEFGNYPFVRVRSSSAKEHAIVTVLVAQSHDVVGRPAIDLNLNKNGWRFSVNGVEGFIDTTGVIPDVQ